MAHVERPLVSVLTSTYQGESFVADTIESVLGQTYPEIEHILVDDGSTDATGDILDRYAARHAKRIRVLRRESRAGPCRRRNDALAEARGSLLAWLDHDDLWLPEKIERQVDALAERPAVAVAFTQYEEFDDATGTTTYRSTIDGSGDFLHRLFVEGCFVASSTALLRRETLDRRVGRFRDLDFSFGDDYFLWLTLLLEGDAVLVDEPLTRLRRHSGNESVRLGRVNTELRALWLLEEFLDQTPDAIARLGDACRVGLARHWAAAAEWELGRGSRWRAATFAFRAAALHPRGAAAYAWRRKAVAPRRALHLATRTRAATRRRVA